jgi:hypothetical protein
MTRGDVHWPDKNTIRDWNYFDAYNQNNDCEDNDLKNMILNNNHEFIQLDNYKHNHSCNYNWYYYIILLIILFILLYFICNF